MMYTVGEMADMLGIAPSTLRYYDKEGLLPFVERTDKGISIFSDRDVEWLRIIECLKKTGMRLKDIRHFILMAMEGDSTIAERLALITARQTEVRRQISELEDTLLTLDFKRWYYETAKEAGTTAVPREMAEEQLPERFRGIRQALCAPYGSRDKDGGGGASGQGEES